MDSKTVKEFDKASKGKKLPERVGRGQSKKVGCGHASCKVGKGCSMKTGKGQGPPIRDNWAQEPTSTDSFTMTKKIAPKPSPLGTPKAYETTFDEQYKKEELPVGGGQAKRVGKGQEAVKPPSDKMPKRKPRGAQPLPGAKKAVSRRHRPPMNRKPPGIPPMGGPAAAPMAAGAGVPGGPPGMGMPPPMGMPGMPPQIPGMGQSKKRGY